MERYWIRNRGRVQGPFNIDRIQGLMRRGRFNRHFHVSEDKKTWLPAVDFPELFDGVSPSRGGGSGDDDEVFQGGGSPFDEDYDAAPTRSGGSSGSKHSAFDGADEDEDDEDWKDDDEDWEDDDYSDGVLGGLVRWVEANTRPIVFVLLLVLGGLGWFVFGRESFTQDKADLEVLIAVNTRISTAHTTGGDANSWTSLSDTVQRELASLVERLNETASAKDHVKQELLFAARDDIPRMFRELPQGKDEAQKRILLRFSKIDRMITQETRIEVLPLTPAPPVATSRPMPAEGGDSAGQSQEIPGRPGAVPSVQSNPDPAAQNPVRPTGADTQQQMSPTGVAAPAPNTTAPNMTPSPGSGNMTDAVSPASGIPGRPMPKN